MGRGEYLRAYPNGGPQRYNGPATGEKYERFIAAVKRRDMENRRGGEAKFWWSVVFLGAVFIAVSIFQGWGMGLFAALVLILCWCFVQMGMNLPNR